MRKAKNKDNSFVKKLRVAMAENEMYKTKDLVTLPNKPQSTITSMLQTNNMKESEMRYYADLLGFDMQITLTSRKTGMII